MLSRLVNVCKVIITGLSRGSIIDVSTIQGMIGITYKVGISSNQLWGKALAELANQGYLTFYQRTTNKTTIHKWIVA